MRVLVGPLGSGKTQASIVEILHRVMAQPPSRRTVFASHAGWRYETPCPTSSPRPSKTSKAITEGMGIGTWRNVSPVTCTIDTVGTDGIPVKAEIMFRSFDSGLDEKKARGMQLTGCWLNELKELHKGNVDMILSQVGRYREGRVPG